MHRVTTCMGQSTKICGVPPPTKELTPRLVRVGAGSSARARDKDSDMRSNEWYEQKKYGVHPTQLMCKYKLKYISEDD